MLTSLLRCFSGTASERERARDWDGRCSFPGLLLPLLLSHPHSPSVAVVVACFGTEVEDSTPSPLLNDVSCLPLHFSALFLSSFFPSLTPCSLSLSPSHGKSRFLSLIRWQNLGSSFSSFCCRCPSVAVVDAAVEYGSSSSSRRSCKRCSCGGGKRERRHTTRFRSACVCASCCLCADVESSRVTTAT